jgi:hypothetical protein
MATGESASYDLPFPLAGDQVKVHTDIKQLVDRLEAVLPAASYSQIVARNVSGTTISAGDPVYITGYQSNNTTVARATSSTTNPILGLAKQSIANNATGVVVVSGVVEDINTSAFTAGDILFVGSSGGLTTTQPASGAAVGVVAHAAEHGSIIIDAKGNGTWGALKAGLA